MRRFVLPTLLSIAVLTASAGACQAAGGMLARLNKSFFPTAPGLPTASPLGLIAPRLSNTVSIFQFGGMRTPAGRLAGLGVIAPRLTRRRPAGRRVSIMRGHEAHRQRRKGS